MNLKCEERLVYQPSKLQGIASAKIIDQSIKLDCIEKKYFKRNCTDVVNLVVKNKWYCKGGKIEEHLSIKPLEANRAELYTEYIEHAFQYNPHETVHKSQVNFNARNERLFSCKRKLFE